MPNNKILTPTQTLHLLENLPPGVTIEFKKSPQGDIMLNNDIPKTKQQLILEKFPDLVGQPITLSEAAKKYCVPRGAIQGWVYQSNYIRFIDQDSYPQLIDEADVALCAWIYKERKKTNTSGLPYFDAQGYLITEVKRPASSRRNPKKEKSGNEKE